uniref:Uncharacterized protein n=1 Tax=Octopus bimaculoides TaxID=37653 RepID=A0A0L8H7S2_OCTBM
MHCIALGTRNIVKAALDATVPAKKPAVQTVMKRTATISIARPEMVNKYGLLKGYVRPSEGLLAYQYKNIPYLCPGQQTLIVHNSWLCNKKYTRLVQFTTVNSSSRSTIKTSECFFSNNTSNSSNRNSLDTLSETKVDPEKSDIVKYLSSQASSCLCQKHRSHV